MADKKISALTASALPLAGTEVLPIVQSGSTVKVAVSDLTAGRAVSATQLTLTTQNLIIGTTGKGVTTGSAIPLGFGVNTAVTAMTIDTASKVGVGTTAPTDLFTVSGGSIASVIAGSGAGLQMGRIAMYSSALGAAFTNYGGEIRSFSGAGIDVSDLRFYTANGAPTAERMRISAEGDLIIGTSTASTNKIVQNGAINTITNDFSARSASMALNDTLTISNLTTGVIEISEMAFFSNIAVIAVSGAATAIVYRSDLATTITAGNPGTLNVYRSGANVIIENKNAATLQVRTNIRKLG